MSSPKRTLESVLEELEQRTLPNSDRTWLDVAAEAARAEGVLLREVVDHARHPRVVAARHRTWHRLRELAGASFPQLARAFRFDHSTVMHGVRMHEQRVARALERRTGT